MCDSKKKKSGQDSNILGQSMRKGGHAGIGKPAAAGTDQGPMQKEDPATKVRVASAAKNGRGR